MTTRMSDPYQRKPNTISEPNEWHEFSFQVSIDRPVNWDNVDLRKWGRTVARFSALLMAESYKSEDFPEADKDLIKALLMNLKVSRISLATDEELHSLIDSFGDDDTDSE